MQEVINFINAVQACFPPEDLGSSPPTNAPGGMPNGQPYNPGGNLQDQLDNDMICVDYGLNDAQGIASPLAIDSAPGGYHTPIAPGIIMNLDVVNSGGFNFSDSITNKLNSPSGFPGAITFGGSDFSPMGFIDNMETMMHELQHSNENLNAPGTEDPDNIEAPVWASMGKMWCSLLECPPATLNNPEAEAAIDEAKDEICARLKLINGQLDDMDSEQLECEACGGDDEASSNEGTEGDGHPGAGGGTGGDLGYCGWNTLYRRSDYHTQTYVSDGSGAILARVSYADRSVAVNYFRDGAQPASFDVTSSQISLPPGSGDFLPISVQAVGGNSLVVGGYAELTGEGVFVKLNFAASTTTVGSGGFPVPPVTSSTSQILFQDCSVTYPVAMAHRRGDSHLYFIDRDAGALMALDLNSGTTYTIASHANYPQLGDALTLRVDTWRDDYDTPLMGAMIEVSDQRISGLGVFSAERMHFNVSDTDNNGRMDLFQ